MAKKKNELRTEEDWGLPNMDRSEVVAPPQQAPAKPANLMTTTSAPQAPQSDSQDTILTATTGNPWDSKPWLPPGGPVDRIDTDAPNSPTEYSPPQDGIPVFDEDTGKTIDVTTGKVVNDSTGGSTGGSTGEETEVKTKELTEEQLKTLSTINQMVSDPSQVLKDKGIEQAYTPHVVDEATEILDPNKFTLDPLGNINTQTVDNITAQAADTVKAGQAQASDAVTPGQVQAADPVVAQQAQAAADVQVAEFNASLVDPSELTKAVDKLAQAEPLVASSMADKLDGLLQGMEEGNVPMWARPAVAKVEQMLAGRGISASSVGRDSLFNAIIQSAMPIAQQDATLEQDAAKTRYGAKVQTILSDVNMEFAAKQFNATSVNQTNQFRAQLQAQVEMQNASRKDALAQFNANLKTQVATQNAARQDDVSKFNTQLSTQAALQEAARQDAMSQFNTQLTTQTELKEAARQDAMSQFNVQTTLQTEQFNASQVNSMTQMATQLQAQREQFNAQMASQIEQSNVNWRRQVNQANTAGVNAVNQANVQNAFNLSNQGLTFLWQEMRDEAHWEFQATEAEKDRKNQLEATLLASEVAMGGEIGKTVENILNGSNFVTKFLDSWG